MTTEAEAPQRTLEESKQRLIAALEDFTTSVDPCEHGHVEHTAADHIGEHIVHTMAGSFGADWSYDKAVEFINGADKVIRTTGIVAALGHKGAARNNGRWVAFQTKDEKED